MRATSTLFAALLLSVSAVGQSIDPQKIAFDYVRLPLVPLPAGTRTYTPTVVLRYEEAVQQQKANHAAAVTEAKEKAEKAKQDYKAQSFGAKALNRIVLDERKPGEAVIPPAEYTAQLYDGKTLATTYVALSGLQRAQAADASDLLVTISLDGFVQGPIAPVAVQASQVKVGGTALGDGIKHAYEVAYKSPMAVKVATKDGTVLLDEMVEATNTYQKARTQEFGTEEALAKYWKTNYTAFLRQLDETQMKANMKVVADYLNSKIGQATVTRNTAIVVVSDKKVNYDEYPQAYEKALMGYKMLGDPSRVADAQKQISEALALWTKALAESNPKDKKARIDEKVTAATLLNAAEANLWLNNFDEAERLLARLKLLDIYRYNEAAKELSAVLQEQRVRFNSNKKS
jgi:hypothetical protein